MASTICQWMKEGQPINAVNMDFHGKINLQLESTSKTLRACEIKGLP
jgi:hypothetical protein